MTADRLRKLDLVADLDDVVEEGRYLAVVKALDCQLDVAGRLRR